MSPPTIAVWKFTSCDGCQLTLLDCEDELLALADAVRIEHFLEAGSDVRPGPYDISFVEGSVSTPAEAERIRRIRAESTTLVAIGACALHGGIQALRNLGDTAEFISVVYADPAYISTLDKVTPIADHVHVDYEIPGCPIGKAGLLEVIGALLVGRRPQLPTGSVCQTCKRRGITCVTVADRVDCLGPVTLDGCGALCPAVHRGCFGCYGPKAGVAADASGWPR